MMTEIVGGSDDDDDGLKDDLSEVSESPLWVSICDFLTPPDVSGYAHG